MITLMAFSMTNESTDQFKVWAFLKRNVSLLTHDEYRAGHVGFHCSNTRRLKAIRGYTVNIHDESICLGKRLASSDMVTVLCEPKGFLELWDGFPAVLFDDRRRWIEAGTPEPTRATDRGLTIDPDWTMSDGPYLFDRVDSASSQFRSYHTRMEETVIVPVMRAETRPCKLVQFFRLAPALSIADFKREVLQRYAPLCGSMTGLNGLIVNFRDQDIDAAAKGYYPDDHWCFTAEGRAFRKQFYDLWTGAIELYFDDLECFLEARKTHPEIARILEMERQLFDSLWYVQVDENVIVMPNRSAPPAFYYR